MSEMNNLNEQQEKLLEMFKWFDEYCEKNGIRYYAIGGTLLGAVRHKGFIPWDDDIDVGVPRPDYEKLLSLFTKKEGKYFLETPYMNNKDYLYSYAKLYDTTTTFVENTRYECRRGIYIDIFPLDGMGNSEEECLKNYSKVDKWNMFLMTRTCIIRKGRAWYKNLLTVILGNIPGINNKKLSVKVADLAARFNYDECDYIANAMGAYREKEIVKKSIIGNPTRYEFEDTYTNGIEFYDEYLTHVYGDWRKLPPIEKQKPHHDFKELDLNKPYMVAQD